MRAIIKRVGQSPQVEDIKNDLQTLQELVGGYIECVMVGKGIVLIVNEEGKLQGLPQNFPLGNDVIVGTAVFVGNGFDGDFTDLTDEQIETVKGSIYDEGLTVREERLVIVEIAKRAEIMDLMMFDRMSLIMDLEAVHAEVGLKLIELLKADDLNFAHDIIGIQQNIDRRTRKLKNMFLPRYAKGGN